MVSIVNNLVDQELSRHQCLKERSNQNHEGQILLRISENQESISCWQLRAKQSPPIVVCLENAIDLQLKQACGEHRRIMDC